MSEPTAPVRPRRIVCFRLTAIVIGLVAGVAIAEVSLRVMGIQPVKVMTKRQLNDLDSPVPRYFHCYPDNPSGELSPAPDVSEGRWRLHDYSFERTELPLERLSETPWCVECRHSSRGIRDREFEEPPPEGHVRLAIVGDSFVFGEGVPEVKTLPRQLEGLLKPNVECVNAGQVGANIEQEAAILEAVVNGAHCQAALLVLIPNDIPLTRELAERQEYINDLILVRDKYLDEHRGWFQGRSRVLDLALSPWQMAKIRRETIQWYLDSYDPRWNAKNLRQLQDLLTNVKKSSTVPVGVVLYPLMEGFETNYPLQPVHDVLAEAARNAELPVCDLAPAFAGANTESLWVHPSDRHPNGSAHRRAAEEIARWLREDHPDWLKPFDASGTEAP